MNMPFLPTPPSIQVPQIPQAPSAPASSIPLDENTKSAVTGILSAMRGGSTQKIQDKGPDSIPASKYLDENTTKGVASILEAMKPKEKEVEEHAEKATIVKCTNCAGKGKLLQKQGDNSTKVVPCLDCGGRGVILAQESKIKESAITSADIGKQVLVYSFTKNHPMDRGAITKVDDTMVYVDDFGWEKEEYDFVLRQPFQESVRDWISSKISGALVSLQVPQEQYASIEDAVYSAALSGKLGDGTPSDKTAQAIASMVTELAGTQAAPTPTPVQTATVGQEVGLENNVEVALPEEPVVAPSQEEPSLDSEDKIQAEIDKLSNEIQDENPVASPLKDIDISEEDVEVEYKGKKTFVNYNELFQGILVELEHTDDPLEAQKIALDHLVGENCPYYYQKLKEVEQIACK